MSKRGNVPRMAQHSSIYYTTPLKVNHTPPNNPIPYTSRASLPFKPSSQHLPALHCTHPFSLCIPPDSPTQILINTTCNSSYQLSVAIPQNLSIPLHFPKLPKFLYTSSTKPHKTAITKPLSLPSTFFTFPTFIITPQNYF